MRALERATDIAIVAAVVQQSGLERLRLWFDQALARGARIRLRRQARVARPVPVSARAGAERRRIPLGIDRWRTL
jgi:hypothetical protein